MFNLQEALDNRLAALEGKRSGKATAKNNGLNDTSLTYIKKSLIQAGIINKKGKLVKRVPVA